MEESHTKPPPRLRRNLAILMLARRGYFTNRGLPPYLLSTLFWFVMETNRIPLTQSVLPIIHDDNIRQIITMAIREQGDQWHPPKPFISAWTFFTKAGIFPTSGQQIDDLLQIDYASLLDGIQVPNNADLGLFWGGLADFLINSWSELEEFCHIPAIKEKMTESNRLSETQEPPGVTKVISWLDMQLEHHLLNIVVRLRAGWDKLTDYVLAPYFGVSSMPREWPKRLDKLDRILRIALKGRQIEFWDDILRNSREIAHKGGLKDVRDFEMHKIALRAKETLGDKARAHSLEQLEGFAIGEHYRLQDTFVLCLGMIRSRSSP